MGKAVTFIFILFLAVIAYLAVFNRESVTIFVTGDTVYEIPKIALVLISATAGALLMLIVYTIRDTRRLIENIQTQKRQKRRDRVQALHSRALGAIYAGNRDAAVEALKEILTEDRENTQALLRLGELALEERDLKRAREYFKRARSAEPDNTEALLSLARVRELEGEYEEALGLLDEALRKDHHNVRALYRKREILERLGRWGELVDLQRGVVKAAHNEGEKKREQERLIGYKYEYGREALEAGELEKAKKAFRTVIKLDKGFIPAHLGLAEVMIQEQDTEGAINYLEGIYRQGRSLIVLARLEDLLLSVEQPSRLISLYKQSVAEEPGDSVLKFFLAKLYYRLEMLDDALDVIQGIESPSSFLPEIAKIRGGIYLKRGQAEMAAEEFRSALDMKRTLRLPYCCTDCGEVFEEWSGRCPSCGRWNTFYFRIRGACPAGGGGAGIQQGRTER